MTDQPQTTAPRYQHDCARCVFLGTFDYDAPLADGTTTPMQADLYRCDGRVLGASYIARYSSEGSEYASMPGDILPGFIIEVEKRGQHSSYSQALIECYRRGQAKEQR